MKEKILLSNLTDYQKVLLTQASFLNIDIKKYQQLKEIEDIYLWKLIKILKTKHKSYFGISGKCVTGMKTTHLELLKEIKKANLGNLKIKDIKKNNLNGFFAISFTDSSNKTGISICGTNTSNVYDFILDAMTDIKERITNDTSQRHDAISFFMKNKNDNNQNYLFGHSLGGNLVEHIYRDNHEIISGVFIINPLPIDESFLNTKEIIEAFNKKKFECIIIGGDFVSELNSYEKYKNNIKFVINNCKYKRNMFSNHITQSAYYNKEGNFNSANSKDIAYKNKTGFFQKIITKTIYYFGGKVRKIHDKLRKRKH